MLVLFPQAWVPCLQVLGSGLHFILSPLVCASKSAEWTPCPNKIFGQRKFFWDWEHGTHLLPITITSPGPEMTVLQSNVLSTVSNVRVEGAVGTVAVRCAPLLPRWVHKILKTISNGSQAQDWPCMDSHEESRTCGWIQSYFAEQQIGFVKWSQLKWRLKSLGPFFVVYGPP